VLIAIVPLPSTRKFNIESEKMNAMKILDIVLIAGGFPGLAQDDFSHAKVDHDTAIGPQVLPVKGNDGACVDDGGDHQRCAGAHVV
jgi:hypothetical protein